MFFDRDLDEEEDEETGNADERDLDQKRPTPAHPVIEPAADRSAQTHAQAEDDVAVALPDTAAAEGNEVSGDEDGNRIQAAAAHTGDHAAGDDCAFRLGEPTDQTPGAKEDV